MEREIRNEVYANPAARPDDEMDYKFVEETQTEASTTIVATIQDESNDVSKTLQQSWILHNGF